MKRALKMLGALAFAAVGFLFATPAEAQSPVSCTPVSGSAAWPWGGATKWCGSATQGQGGSAAITLNNILSASSTTQGDFSKTAGSILKNYPSNGSVGIGARFWVFGTSAEFASYCTSSSGGVNHWTEFGYTSAAHCPSAPPAGVLGVTFYNDSTLNARYAVIFTSALSLPYYAGATVSSAVAHEAGHFVNASSEWRTLLGAGANVLASDSTNFQNELNKDYDTFNLETPPCPTIFGGSKDDQLRWICSGTNGNGNSLNSANGYSSPNESVLKRAWGHFFLASEATAIITIGGTVSVNDSLTITITDPTVTGNPVSVFFLVTSPGTTKAQIAASLVSSINSSTALQSKRIQAFQGGLNGTTPEDILLISGSRGFTKYSVIVGGAGPRTETMTLNTQIPYGFAYPSNGEFFAQVFESNTPYKWNGVASPDKVFVTNTHFPCTKELLRSLAIYGQVPGRTGSVVPWPQ